MEEKKRQLRGAFPYLTDTEFAKIEKLEDNTREIQDAKALNHQRFEI